MSIYKVLRKAEQFGIRFRVCDSKDAGVGSCDQFLAELRLRDCSVYTQRAYALGLAHFFSWLRASGGDPDQATRQVIGSYITEFARGAKQGAVGARGRSSGAIQVCSLETMFYAPSRQASAEAEISRRRDLPISSIPLDCS